MADPFRLSSLILIALYTLSGVTALAYEVLWARMFSLQFGVSVFGVVVTVAAFMAGLGIGSLLILRWLHQIRRPLLVFAGLECFVALFAVLLPLMIRLMDGALLSMASESLTSWYASEMISALLLMLMPAMALGAGFPLVLHVAKGESISLSVIYGVNTLGGMAGALLPLLLLPLLGWVVSVNVVAAMGLIVAVSAVILMIRLHGWGGETTVPVAMDAPPPLSPSQAMTINSKALLAYAGLGCAALILQIGWTRLYGMIFLRTEYVLAIILATFLMGMGLGSLLTKRINHQRFLPLLPWIAGFFALLALWAIPLLTSLLAYFEFDSLISSLFWQGMAIAVLTLPVTLALGAWLPLITERYGAFDGLGGRLYGVNAVGSAVGAMLAGFVLIPTLGTQQTVLVGIVLLVCCGLYWARSRRSWWMVLPMLVVATLLSTLPPASALLPNIHANNVDLSVEEDAVSITHVVEQPDGQRLLLSDLQRMDASSAVEAVVLQKNQARLPLLLHAKPESVLFLGLGTGISASGALAYPGIEITAIELSAGAIAASKNYFSLVNDGVNDKITIVRDDARRYLRATDQVFDVIIGDVFHPDMVGRGSLLSVEQFERSASRLTESGVFVQWLALNQLDKHSLKVILRSFQRAFPDAVLYLDGFRLALVGGGAGFRVGSDMWANFEQLPLASRDELTGGEGLWSWQGRYFGRIQGYLAGTEGKVQSEWAPQIEYHLPGIRYSEQLQMLDALAWLLAGRPLVEESVLQLGLQNVAEQGAELDLFRDAYRATLLAQKSWLADLGGRSYESQQLIHLANRANPKDRWVSRSLADKMLASLPQVISRGMDRVSALTQILQIDPDHLNALQALWQVMRSTGNTAEADRIRARILILSPLDKGN